MTLALFALAGSVTRRHLVASAAALVGSSVAEGLGVLMLLPLLQLAGVAGASATSDAISRTLATALAALGAQPTLAVVLGIYVAVAVLQSGVQRWQAVTTVRIEQEIVTALRQRVYRAIGNAEWVFFARQRTSDCLHVLTSEIERAGGAVYCAIDLLAAAGIALVYFALAFHLSPAITVSVGIFGVLLAAAMHRHLAAARASGRLLSQTMEALYAAVAQHFGGLKTAMSFAAVDRHEASFARLAGDVHTVRVRAAVDYARFRQWMGVGSAAGLAGIVYIALTQLAMPTADLLVLLFIFARLMPRLTGLYEKLQVLAAQWPAFQAVVEFQRQAAAAARPLIAAPAPLEWHREICLDHVTFAYDETRGAPAVADLNVSIVAGTTTAIVGPSGSGKTTVADLLMTLIRPSAGRVLVDGHALTADMMAAWRAQVAYVPQDTFLFHDSIRANLEWARPGVTEPEIWYALQLAAADEFVRALPQGLETIVGDRGVLLSGGERQRLSLARALIRQPRVLILDEATSSLDSENERRIQRAVDRLHRQMTVVVITHRLSTIRHADMIHVMDGGRLVQSGTWDELRSASNGRFHDLWHAQGMTADVRKSALMRRYEPALEVVNR
jgi:ATP-binding cassette subfamily C protein